jgi:hypothetical protein
MRRKSRRCRTRSCWPRSIATEPRAAFTGSRFQRGVPFASLAAARAAHRLPADLAGVGIGFAAPALTPALSRAGGRGRVPGSNFRRPRMRAHPALSRGAGEGESQGATFGRPRAALTPALSRAAGEGESRGAISGRPRLPSPRPSPARAGEGESGATSAQHPSPVRRERESAGLHSTLPRAREKGWG